MGAATYPASARFAAARAKSGAERSRTADLLNAIQALSQLSYSPSPGGSERLDSPNQPDGQGNDAAIAL